MSGLLIRIRVSAREIKEKKKKGGRSWRERRGKAQKKGKKKLRELVDI
jgi:hypothetical protein